MQALILWQAITGESGLALSSPHAIAFSKRLDWHHILGWPSHRPPPVNYDVYMKLKQQYPDKLIGHRASSSQPYWFVGVDAVIVTELMDSKGEALSLVCVPFSRTTWGRHFVSVCRISYGHAKFVSWCHTVCRRDEDYHCPRCAILPHHAATYVSSICTKYQLEVVVVDRVMKDDKAITSMQICTPHQPYLLGSPSAVSSTTSGECIAAGTYRVFDESNDENHGLVATFTSMHAARCYACVDMHVPA